MIRLVAIGLSLLVAGCSAIPSVKYTGERCRDSDLDPPHDCVYDPWLGREIGYGHWQRGDHVFDARGHRLGTSQDFH
jgi:hypothetical protein